MVTVAPMQMPTPPPAPTTTDWTDVNFCMPGNIWLNALEKRVSAHVRMPRSGGEGKPGTSHPSFNMAASPPGAVRLKCEQAGIPLKSTKGKVTTYEGHGPMMAYKFCSTQKHKKLGQGSGALMAPGKFRTSSDILIFAVPPVIVSHNSETWQMKVEFYLCVYNGEGHDQTGRITLPPNPNKLYGTQDVETLFEKTALHILGEMRVRRLPLSTNFKTILGSDSEEEEEPAAARATKATATTKRVAAATVAKAKRVAAWPSQEW